MSVKVESHLRNFILSTSGLCGMFLLMFERRFINVQHNMSKHFQYKIIYIVIYYSGNILINKNNTRHRKRGHKKWRHQCKTNSLRKKFSVKNICLIVSYAFMLCEKISTRAKISFFQICNIQKRQMSVIKTLSACIRVCN